jgi:uncharacterized protein (TIGR03084 family)
MGADAIYTDLEAELDRLEEILAGLDDDAWRSPSAAPGWSVADVMLHLAQTEEGVVTTIAASTQRPAETRPDGDGTTDERMEIMVAAERTEPAAVFERWRTARRAALDALRTADPDVRVAWAAWPLKPATLATTRIAEHWAHALDIVEPLTIPFPDTDRLRHIAWLGHGTLPYAFGLAGEPARVVRCELTAPDGASVWTFGPADAESTITGAAGAFCRVGAQRLAPAESGLVTTGPYGAAALAMLRNYAA